MAIKVKINTLYINRNGYFRVVVALEPGGGVAWYVDPDSEWGSETPSCCSVRQIKRWSEREATPEEIKDSGWEPYSTQVLEAYQKITTACHSETR